MSEAEAIWGRKSDDEIVAAAASLDEYTDEGRKVILAEANRRGLRVAPIRRAAEELTHRTTETDGRCAYCDTRILFGGRRHGQVRFCNEACYHDGIRLFASEAIPDHVVNRHVWSVYNGNCPACGGPGPVDVHTSHRVISGIVFSSWRNRPAVTCRSCADKAKIRDALISLVGGWWALPGIVMTPIQIARNIAGLLDRPFTNQPSPRLHKLVRLELVDASLSGPSDARRDMPD